MIVGILGGTGFVGSNLSEFVSRLGIRCVSGSRRTGIDARNADALWGWIKENDITHLVNLAAEVGGIGANMRKPADLWYATQQISSVVFDVCRAAGISKLIQVGTVCSYSAHCPVPFKEEYLMNYGPPEPTNRAYGVAKLSAAYGGQAYHKQYGLRICNLIPVNMYGPRDLFDLENSHVIPAIVLKIANARKTGETVQLWGTGNATREFLYISDFCRAVELALSSDAEETIDGTFINVGTGSEISICDLVKLTCQIMSFPYDKILWDHSKPDGQLKRRLDITRAIRVLGYRPLVKLDNGLKLTIGWFEGSRA